LGRVTSRWPRLFTDRVDMGAGWSPQPASKARIAHDGDVPVPISTGQQDGPFKKGDRHRVAVRQLTSMRQADSEPVPLFELPNEQSGLNDRARLWNTEEPNVRSPPGPVPGGDGFDDYSAEFPKPSFPQHRAGGEVVTTLWPSRSRQTCSHRHGASLLYTSPTPSGLPGW
jgi:hypothetical protein